MGLGLDFADDAWLGHLAGLALIIAVMSPPMPWMRLGLAASGVFALIYALTSPGNLGTALWAALLILVSLSMLIRYALAEQAAKFSDEENALRDILMPDLNRASARHLMDRGNWINGKAGETLITEDEAISHLFYLSQGRADVLLKGRTIAHCQSGQLIGDVTALSGEPASGTVKLSQDSRFWCISAPQLRQYLDLHPNVRTAIERQINAALDAKLRAANQSLAGA
jgi:CRP/FNR family transcriptional regulator, cyclic AMP receptor protein